MKLLYLLADHVFRFKYLNSVSEDEKGNLVWDIGVHEEQSEKARKDFFIMGFVCATILCIIAGVALWMI